MTNEVMNEEVNRREDKKESTSGRNYLIALKWFSHTEKKSVERLTQTV